MSSEVNAWSNAIYESWLREAVLAAYIQMPWPHDLKLLVGHDPQLLLEYKPAQTAEMAQLWSKAVLDEMMGMSYAQMSEAMFPKEIDNEFIDFEPRYRTETVIVAGSDGVVFDIESYDVPISRNLTPFIVPVGRVTYEHINNMQDVVPRWGEADTDPLQDIQDFYNRMNDRVAILPSCHGKTDASQEWVKFFLHADFSAVEMHALMATLKHETRGVILELDRTGGAIPGMNDVIAGFTKAAAKAEHLPSRPDYHKHDRTKSHKRTRR